MPHNLPPRTACPALLPPLTKRQAFNCGGRHHSLCNNRPGLLTPYSRCSSGCGAAEIGPNDKDPTRCASAGARVEALLAGETNAPDTRWRPVCSAFIASHWRTMTGGTVRKVLLVVTESKEDNLSSRMRMAAPGSPRP